MTTTLYGISRTRAQTDLVVTALHAAGFGPSDISILDAGAKDSVSQLTGLGLSEAEAEQYCAPLLPGAHIITVTADTNEQVAEARDVFEATSVANVRIQSPQAVRL